MPNKAAASKALRQDANKAVRNQNTIAKIRDLQRHFRIAITNKDKTNAEKLLQDLTKSLDKAAQKNTIKKNTAARKKSRLRKKLNSLDQTDKKNS